MRGSATVRMWSGRGFQVAGPACENARSPNFVLLAVSRFAKYNFLLVFYSDFRSKRLQCFDTAGRASGRAPGV